MEEKTKQYILKLARRAIETYVRTGRIISKPKDYPKELDEKRGVFCNDKQNLSLKTYTTP
jgi:hypothetical protein